MTAKPTKSIRSSKRIVRSRCTTKTKSGHSRMKKSKGLHTDRWQRQRRADLMATASSAERVAYKILTVMGYKVVRQFPINTGRKQYYADLYLPEHRCCIEIDGGYHFTENQRRLDRNRSQGLRRLGYHVLRLTNRDARDKEKIKKKLSLLF